MEKKTAKTYDLSKPGKVHFAGIAGSASAPIAIMMRNKGWEVTGSDSNVWEPALSLLNNAGIEWTEGYPPELVDKADVTVFAGQSLYQVPENPQLTRAKELKKPILGFANIIGEILVKENSLVVAGSYGKSTTTSLIAKILDTAGVNPSFMIGGKPKDFDSGVHNTDSDFSVVEGDEYVTIVSIDKSPKFKYYKPKYGLVTAAKWDHLDVYPTEDEYVEAFVDFAKQVEDNDGVLVVCSSGQNIDRVINNYKGNLVTYMIERSQSVLDQEVDYIAKDIDFGDINTPASFEVVFRGESLGRFETEMFGLPNIENNLAALAITHSAGIDIESIREGSKEFSGIKRRHELVGEMKNGAHVYDDFAHSPMKAKASLEALRSKFTDNKIIAIYMPRMNELGDREVLKWYAEAFTDADVVALPKITVKKSTAKGDRIRGKDLLDAIKKGQPNAFYCPREGDVEALIEREADGNSVVVFMSAGGWGDVLEKAIKLVQK